MAAYLNWTGSGGSDTSLLVDGIPLLIDPLLRQTYKELDPFFFNAAVTSEGLVAAGKGLSRDWLIRKALNGQQAAGTVEMASNSVVRGPVATELGSARYRHDRASQATYPSGFDGSFGRPYEMSVGLSGMRASLGLPIAEEDTNALPAVIGDLIGNLMEQWARHLALYRVVAYYTNGKITDAEYLTANESYSSPNGTVTLTVSSKNINSFLTGMQVDIYEGANQRNLDVNDARVPVYVDVVDHFNNTVVLRYSVASGDLAAGTGGMLQKEGLANTETMSIYLRGTYGDSFNGLDAFCKSTAITDTSHPNYYDASAGFFGADLDQYREHQSLVVDAKSSPLTESFVSNVLMKFQAGRAQFGMTIDTILMRPGALAAYHEARLPMQRTMSDRGSQTAMNATGSGIAGGFTMTFNGLTVNGALSNYLRSGDVFMPKIGDQNFKRYVPPTPSRFATALPPGMTAPKGLELDMMGRALGYASENVPVISADGEPTEATQMLARSRMTILPDQLSMAKILNVNEVDIDQFVA